MSRYIDADAMMEEYNLDKATKYGNKTGEEQSFSYSTMMMYEIADMIDDAPTADVRENVKGEWIVIDYNYDGEDEYPIVGCSECEYHIPEDLDAYNFCPNCGADMREEE